MEVYFDNAATTQVLEAAADEMRRVLLEDYGNPSSRHQKGVDAEGYLKRCKKNIAKALKCSEKEIILTSGGTEANNLALLGIAQAYHRSGKHIITTCIEHASVYQPMFFLEECGFEVTYLPVDSNGLVELSALSAALRPDTILVSVMMVNNEIGAIEPVEEIARLVHGYNEKIVFHVDAIQAFGKLKVLPKRMGIDALSVSGHKLHGPKGSGFLYVRDRIKIRPHIYGGGQEGGMRSGTENVPAIAGLSVAIEAMLSEEEARRAQMYRLKTRFVEEVSTLGGHVFGVFSEQTELSVAERVLKTAPHVVSVGFAGVRAEVLLHALEDKGVYVSSGSACSSNHPAISGTLSGIGAPKELLDSTIRFSFSYRNTEEEIDYCISCLRELLPVLSRFRRA